MVGIGIRNEAWIKVELKLNLNALSSATDPADTFKTAVWINRSLLSSNVQEKFSTSPAKFDSRHSVRSNDGAFKYIYN